MISTSEIKYLTNYFMNSKKKSEKMTDFLFLADIVIINIVNFLNVYPYVSHRFSFSKKGRKFQDKMITLIIKQ